jgi:ArsR family transcriptional regulator
VLKNAGIVCDQRRGNQVFYALRTPCVLSFFECMEQVAAESGPQPIALAE